METTQYTGQPIKLNVESLTTLPPEVFYEDNEVASDDSHYQEGSTQDFQVTSTIDKAQAITFLNGLLQNNSGIYSPEEITIIKDKIIELVKTLN